MDRVILRKSNDFEKDLTYKILLEHPNYNNPATNVQSEHSYVRQARNEVGGLIEPVDGHILIEEHHSLGGGMGGWDSYADFIGMAHGKDNLPKKLHECAIFAAKELARKCDAEFVDESVESAQKAGAGE
jgi:hypothetical protein